MARNVEVKVRIASVEALLPRARALADGPPEPIAQDDSFFACARGRLKLRDFGDGHGELIAYERADLAGARTSHYRLVAVPDPAALRDALAGALGVVGRVRKQRLLLRAGRTRVHLDRVDGLGDFLELEVVLREGEDEAEGRAVARALLVALGLGNAELLAPAYLDLLHAGTPRDGRRGDDAGAPKDPGAPT
jgi:adenylate cyclase class IV